MAIYRAVHDLSNGTQAGRLDRLAHLKAEQIDKLLLKGAIARISAPPLAELPGWADRAALLAPAGIIDAEQFLEADAAQIATLLDIPEDSAQQLQCEIESFLVIEDEPGCGCG